MPTSILIVEDDLTFSLMLKTWLGKKGFQVNTVSNISRARRELTDNPYDVNERFEDGECIQGTS